MPKGRRNGKGAPEERTAASRSMNTPAMMDWALRLLNEKEAPASTPICNQRNERDFS
jgi:hypothetical protein